MSLRSRTGDLLTIAARGEAIAHGCNCQGTMGGLAGLIARRWPQLAADYRAACAAGTFTLGGVLPWLDTETGVWIYNLATQLHGGPDARLDAIDGSLRNALVHARDHGVPRVFLPRIGAGIGGLDWHDVRAVLERVADDHPDVELVVVTLPDR